MNTSAPNAVLVRLIELISKHGVHPTQRLRLQRTRLWQVIFDTHRSLMQLPQGVRNHHDPEWGEQNRNEVLNHAATLRSIEFVANIAQQGELPRPYRRRSRGFNVAQPRLRERR